MLNSISCYSYEWYALNGSVLTHSDLPYMAKLLSGKAFAVFMIFSSAAILSVNYLKELNNL